MDMINRYFLIQEAIIAHPAQLAVLIIFVVIMLVLEYLRRRKTR
jgi:hypothetical protein